MKIKGSKVLSRLPLSTFLTFLTFQLFISGCGYRLAGTGSLLPSDAKTIAIPIFRNQTSEPALEATLTRYVKEEFLTHHRLRVINSISEADLVLKGIILSYSLTPLSFDRDTKGALEYRVKILLDITLEDLRSTKVLWREPGLETTAEFFASDDTSARQVAQDRAVAEASQHLAEELIHRVLEGLSN